MIDEPRAGASPLERALGRPFAVNWEVVAWVAIVALTLLTRLWALGDRAMSHDESLHTYYSWKLFMGEGYTHDPMMHGPLLYHATALSYFLFGASDFSARLLAVVSGLALVLSPLLVRRWMGPAGALAAGIMLLVSPTVMYYSRYIRHDIPVELFTVLMFVSFIRFVDDRAGRWVVLAGLAGAGAVTSAEMSYINAFVLLSFIVVALVVERMSRRAATVAEVLMVAAGVGLLVYASLANTGRIAGMGLPEKGTAAHVAMQVAFLVSGMALIYSLVSPLLTRPRALAAADDARPGPRLGDVLPHARAASELPSTAPMRALIGGGLLLVAGVLLVRLPDLAPAATALGRFAGVGPSLMGVGWFLSLYGLAGRLARSAGRHADAAAAAIGAVAVGVWGALWWQSNGALALRAGPALGTPIQSSLLLLVLASGLVLLLGLLGWLVVQRPRRGLAAALAAAPLEAVGAGAAVFAVAYSLMFTTFFSNAPGIHGFANSIRYWLAQHDVVRGGQPWYYYSLLTPMYEFLPVILTVAAVIVYVARRQLRVGMGNDTGDPDAPSVAAWAFVPCLIMWTAGVFWIYSWAGEKMPWLVVHLVVPMTFLGGRLFGDLVAQVEWQEMRRRGWMVAGLVLLAALSLAGWLSVAPFGGQSQEALARTSGFLIGIPIVLLVLWGLAWAAGGMSRRQAWLAAALAGVGLLLFVNTRYSLLANFVNDELATEYIVYAHGTPDDKEVIRILHEMQDRIGLDGPLAVGYDNEVSWPFTWYFRHTDFPSAVYLGDKPSSVLTQDALLVGSPNYGNFEPYLRDRYVSTEFRRMWWPNEGYKNLTPGKIVQSARDRLAWRNLLNILLYRRYTRDPGADAFQPKPLTDWYHHANMRLYVKRDLIQRLWPLVQARPDWLPDTPAPVEGPGRSVEQLVVDVTFELAPDGSPVIAPKGIALGPDGDLYVVDHGQDRIVAFDESGQALAVVADGDLSYPVQDGRTDHSAWGVAVGDDGAVYVADTWNHRVVKYVGGRRTATFGQFGNPSEASTDLQMLFGPRDIAIGPDGNLYVTDTGNDRIVVLRTDLTALRAIGGPGLEPGRFDEPTSLAFDPETGDLFVADLWNLRMQRFDAAMSPVAQWTVDGWESQEAAHKAYVAVGPGSVVIASDPAAQRVWLFSRDGAVLATLDLPADSRGLDQPIGVAIDALGRIYVASSNSSLVTRYQPIDGVTVPATEPADEDEAGEADADELEAEETDAEDGAEEAGAREGVGDTGAAEEDDAPGAGAAPAATSTGAGSGGGP